MAVHTVDTTLNMGKANTLPFSSTSSGHKVKIKVNSNKIQAPDNSNQPAIRVKGLRIFCSNLAMLTVFGRFLQLLLNTLYCV